MSFAKPRMNRLFANSGKCFDVAIDHGFFNELSFLGGIESIDKAIETIVAANPDAIQLTVGQAEVLQKIIENLKWQDEQASYTKKLLMYPAIVSVVIIGMPAQNASSTCRPTAPGLR